MPKGTPQPPVGRIDVPNAIRGASTGFTILIIGGLLAPMWTLVSTVVAGIWLAAVAIGAFAVAARLSQAAGNPPVHGVVAAVTSYVLVLPLLLPFEEGRNVPQIIATFATAIVVGALAGWLAAGRRTSAK